MIYRMENGLVHPIVVRAEGLARAVARAPSRRAFLSALSDFERTLACVPDFPRGSLTGRDGESLAALADAVVASIEERLERHTDRAPVLRMLAGAVYRLREDVETIDMLIRHDDATAAPARR